MTTNRTVPTSHQLFRKHKTNKNQLPWRQIKQNKTEAKIITTSFIYLKRESGGT